MFTQASKRTTWLRVSNLRRMFPFWIVRLFGRVCFPPSGGKLRLRTPGGARLKSKRRLQKPTSGCSQIVTFRRKRQHSSSNLFASAELVSCGRAWRRPSFVIVQRGGSASAKVTSRSLARAAGRRQSPARRAERLRGAAGRFAGRRRQYERAVAGVPFARPADRFLDFQ